MSFAVLTSQKILFTIFESSLFIVNSFQIMYFLRDRIGAENVRFVSGTDCFGSPIN